MKAHATVSYVLDHSISAAERRGNMHAGRFAKLGAAVHPMPEQRLELRGRLVGHQKELLRWAGTQDVLMADRGWSDSSGFPEPVEAVGEGDAEPTSIREQMLKAFSLRKRESWSRELGPQDQL